MRYFNALLAATVGLIWVWFLLLLTSYKDGETTSIAGLSLTQPKQLFNWHPVLMSTSMIGMNYYSVSLFVKALQAGKLHDHQRTKRNHYMLHTGSVVVGLFGVFFVFYFHNTNTPPIPNMYSFHSWLGLVTFLMYAFQLVGGYMFFTDKCLSVSERTKKRAIKYHRRYGLFILIGTLVSVMTGLQEKLGFNGSCNAKLAEAAPEEEGNDTPAMLRILHEGHETGSVQLDCRIGIFIGFLVLILSLYLVASIVTIPSKKDHTKDFTQLQVDFDSDFHDYEDDFGELDIS